MINNKGFTLIETLIAIMVLMLSIVGPLTLASKGLQATLISKDQEIAYYLAQDAIEYVRWTRDTNILRSNNWLAGLDGTANGHINSGAVGGACTAASGCIVDALKDTNASCSGTCSTLNYDSANNYFTYTAANGTTILPSIFTRTVKIVSPIGINDCTATAGHGCEASVNVLVTWSDQGGLIRKASVSENLLNWQ